jgi:hypothetical protein
MQCAASLWAPRRGAPIVAEPGQSSRLHHRQDRKTKLFWEAAQRAGLPRLRWMISPEGWTRLGTQQLSTGQRRQPLPPDLRLARPAEQRWSPAHRAVPSFLPAARCIGTEFPNGNSSPAHAGSSAARGKSSAQNRLQMCPRQAKECRRRGNAPRPCARERRNSGPYHFQF